MVGGYARFMAASGRLQAESSAWKLNREPQTPNSAGLESAAARSALPWLYKTDPAAYVRPLSRTRTFVTFSVVASRHGSASIRFQQQSHGCLEIRPNPKTFTSHDNHENLLQRLTY